MQSDVSHDPRSFVEDFEDTAPYPTAAAIMRRSERLYLNNHKDISSTIAGNMSLLDQSYLAKILSLPASMSAPWLSFSEPVNPCTRNTSQVSLF